MAITLKKVSTGAGVFHQQTIVFRWAAASIAAAILIRGLRPIGRAASFNSGL
jgi:hypothetical protein